MQKEQDNAKLEVQLQELQELQGSTETASAEQEERYNVLTKKHYARSTGLATLFERA